MKDTIIITDLTRFKKEGKVCIAGYSQQQSKIIRPLFSEHIADAYLDQKVCEQYNILPGTRLSGDFESMNHQSPHNEDHLVRGTLNVDTPATKEEFLVVLQETSRETLSLGFGCPINDKVIPLGIVPSCSIVTLAINPDEIQLVAGFNNDINTLKVKLATVGLNPQKPLSLTDLGFYRYAINFVNHSSIDKLNLFLHQQEIIYLRIGLSRSYPAQDGSNRNGYWMQVNGIYTFPNYHKEIRSY